MVGQFLQGGPCSLGTALWVLLCPKKHILHWGSMVESSHLAAPRAAAGSLLLLLLPRALKAGAALQRQALPQPAADCLPVALVHSGEARGSRQQLGPEAEVQRPP